MFIGSLPDPEDPRIVHATDRDGIVCRFNYESNSGKSWPLHWWDNEERPGGPVTCLRCLRGPGWRECE